MSANVTINTKDFATSQSDHEAILESLRATVLSGDWCRHASDVCNLLIEQLSNAFACKHVHLCGSGTAGIELALRAANVPEGSEVVVAGFDYPGNIRAVESTGGKPVIVDTQADRWTIDPEAVEHAISANTSAIIASHLYGNLFDAKALRSIADRRGIALIEDACQAHGAIVDGKPAGSWGDVGVLSFGPSKLMTAGCGGALLMSDDRVAQRAGNLSQRPGVVSPLSPLQAAALLPQLSQLASRNVQRRSAVAMLSERLADSRLWGIPRMRPHENQTTYFKTAWFFHDPENRDAIINSGQASGIPLGRGFNGFLKRAKRTHRTVGNLPHSERCLRCCIVLDQRVLLSSEVTIHKVADLLLMLEEQLEIETQDSVNKR